MRLSAPHHRYNNFVVKSSPTPIPIPIPIPIVSMGSKQDKQGSPVKNVAVIGAGVSGLSAAYKLKLHGLNVTVFEADGIVGGKLRSISRDGLIWDEGANTMTESEAPVGFLLDNLGLRDKQQFPLSQQKRYIAKNGVPVLLPSNPVALVRSNFLSAGAKLQIFLEPFLWKNNNASKGPNAEESVGDFFQRHFGKEAVDYLIDPFVAGTSGGDPGSLSMQHVFPEIWNLEKRFGSIISGAIQSKFSAKKDTSGEMDSSAKKKQKNSSFSFLGGMQTLTNALCDELSKDEIKLKSKVLELACSCSEKSPQDNWSISYELNDKKLSSEKLFDALIVTAPLSDVKQMKITKRGIPFPLDFLPEVSYLPMSVIITTFKRENVKRPLEGFGVLIPSKEQQNGLRTLGYVLNCSHFYWSKGFPLYGLNYGSIIQAIDKMEKDLPGLFYAGNHKGGLSVGKAISSGRQAADFVISYLGSCSDANQNR